MMSTRFNIVRQVLFATTLLLLQAAFYGSSALAQQGIFLQGLGESAQNRDVTEDGTNPPGSEATGQAQVTITCCDPMGMPIQAMHGTEGEAVQNLVNDLVFFDGTPPNFTKWNDLQGDLFMIPTEITLSQPRTVRYYTVTSANDSPERDPWEWRLLGTNVANPTPQDFVEIDTRTEIDFPLRHQTQLFGPLSNNTAYTTYRFEWETQYVAQGAANYPAGLAIPNSIQAAEVELFEDFAGGGAKLEINRGGGATPTSITLSNAGTSPLTIVGYSITSAAGTLNSNNWTSIADTADGDSGGSLDTDQWIELTAPNGRGDLSEVENLNGAQNGVTVAPAASINLGSNAWIKYPTEDVSATILLADGTEQNVAVSYTGGAQYKFGDLNFDRNAALTATDWNTFKQGHGFNFSTVFSAAESYARGDLDGDFDHDLRDFQLFKAAYDAANGAGSFAAMLASVPEPGTAALFGLAALVGMAMSVRRRRALAMCAGLSLVLVSAETSQAQQVIPNLIGNDFTDPATSITITAGTDPANPSPAAEMPPMAVDNNKNTKWLAFVPAGTFYQVQFNGGVQRAANAYTISSANDAPERDPYGWTLSGSNDGTTFTPLDTKTNQDFVNRFETQLFTFSNTTAYNFYKFDFLTAQGAMAPGAPGTNSIQLAEIELLRIANPLSVEVNRATGAVRIVNNDTTAPVPIDAYSLRSAAGSLNRNAWWGTGPTGAPNGGTSIHDQNLDGIGFPDSSGLGTGWEESPGSTNNELREYYLGPGGVGVSTFTSGLAITMNNAFSPGATEDLVFEYSTLGILRQGTVTYTGTSVNIPGDFNNDNRVDAADYVVWRKTNGSPTGYNTWRTNFGRTSGSGSALGSAAGVPEPATALLAVCLPGLLLFVRRRQFTNRTDRGLLENTSAPVSGSRAMTRIFRCATRAGLGLALGLACLLNSATAETIDRNYQLGDDSQENAVAGQVVGQASVVANHTLDSASQGSFFDMPQTGGPTYVNTSPTGGATARPGARPTEKGVQFTGSSSQYLGGSAGFGSPREGGALANPAINDYSNSRFMQIWARPTLDTGARQDVVNDTFQFGIHITAADTWGHTYGGAGGVGTDRDTGAPVVYNQWAHIMQQTFGTGGVAVYVNGVAVSRINAGYNQTTNPVDNRNIYVGTNLGATGGFFTGQVDNLQIGVYGVFVPQNPPIPVDWGTFNLGTDNEYIASLGLVQGDVNGDGVVSGNGSGSAATDDVRFFVDHWLDERRVNNIIVGDLTSRQTMGDLNFDGRTTLADWSILRSAHTSGASLDLAALLGASVPEPTTTALGALTLLSLAGFVRRRQG